MPRAVCIHGHFYQPPRENPWLGEVEVQESASPWHDWNEKVTAECYGPNSAARILDGDGWIRRIVNNYSRISFNFGPTLLSWMEKRQPRLYCAVIEADRVGAGRFSGHGPAIAQAYNHMILPLACTRDKITQVLWGAEDFRSRFGRPPEGMWLPETAVDLETLDVLAQCGIAFTILAPRQGASVRAAGSERWIDVRGEKIDTSRPYACSLPSGRTISIFFFNGPLAHEVAFGSALGDGSSFAAMLMDQLPEDPGREGLVSLATDGETFGHHHKYGDMALAYCLEELERSGRVRLTVYGEYLEANPPRDEVVIAEKTSWSCIHGVERWRDDCGCSTETRQGWKQNWRKPLRRALDSLRDELNPLFEQEGRSFLFDPWGARDRYIQVVLDRSPASVSKFLESEAVRRLSREEEVRVLSLLEMERNLMLMYTSCGWFFADVSRIETIQILMYAARAAELAEGVFQGRDFGSSFRVLLGAAPSNVREAGDGGQVYDSSVLPARSDLSRAAANFAVSSLFPDGYGSGERTGFYSCRILSRSVGMAESGNCRFLHGFFRVRSEMTTEENDFFAAALHRGGWRLLCGVAAAPEGGWKKDDLERMEGAVRKGDEKALSLFFGRSVYSFCHLFRDEQRRILWHILQKDLTALTERMREAVKDYSELLSFLAALSMPLPEALRRVAEVVLNDDLKRAMESAPLPLARIEDLVEDALGWGIALDIASLAHAARRRMESWLLALGESPWDLDALGEMHSLLSFLRKRGWDVNLWDVQNSFFSAAVSEGIPPPGAREMFDGVKDLLFIRPDGGAGGFSPPSARIVTRRGDRP